MTDDTEIEAIRAAYAVIKGMNRAQWTRALKYLETRMAEDDRATYIGRTELPSPVQYVAAGNIGEAFDSPEEAIRESYYEEPIMEINGIATVSQRFAVEVSSDDGTLEWFDTRDAAEAFLESMKT